MTEPTTEGQPVVDGLWVPVDSPLIDGPEGLWQDAPTDEEQRALILATAQEECTAYAGRVPAPVPARFKVALLLHARAIHRAFVTGDGDTIGPDGQRVVVHPMDRSVKARLRPTRPRFPQ